MVMIKDNEGIERYSVSTKLYKFLQRIKEKINEEDQEAWIAYYGKTGTGKSMRAQRDAFVIDKTLENSRVCFSAEEFIKAVIEAKKGQCVIADEAVSIFFSRSSMTKEGRLIAEISNQIRQKNLCIMLCIPQVLALDWLILDKLNCITYVWEDRKDGKTYKSNAAYFVEHRRKPIKSYLIKFLKLKRNNPRVRARKPIPSITERGNVVSKDPFYPVDAKKYKEKKESILKKYLKTDEPLTKREDKIRSARDKAVLHLRGLKMSIGNIAKTLGLSKSTIHAIITKENED